MALTHGTDARQKMVPPWRGVRAARRVPTLVHRSAPAAAGQFPSSAAQPSTAALATAAEPAAALAASAEPLATAALRPWLPGSALRPTAAPH